MSAQQLEGQMSIDDALVTRKVVRWTACKETSIWDHKCDQLPEGMQFHKFHIDNTPEEKQAFNSEGFYEREVVCPYCGKHVVYVFTNMLFESDECS